MNDWVTATVLEATPGKTDKGDAQLEVQLQTPDGVMYEATIANWSEYQWPAYEPGKEVSCLLQEKKDGGHYIKATKGCKKLAEDGAPKANGGGEAAAKSEAPAQPGPAKPAAPASVPHAYHVTKSDADLRSDIFAHTSRLWVAGCAQPGVTFHGFMQAAEGYILRGERLAVKYSIIVPPTMASK